MTKGWAQAYAGAFDRLAPETLEDLRRLLHENAEFQDPFNTLHGADAVIGLMQKMFEDTQSPRFETAQVLEAGPFAFIKWRFSCQATYFGKLEFDGVSEVHCDQDGLVTKHIDYWDAGAEVYGRLPVLGGAVRFVRGRLAFRG